MLTVSDLNVQIINEFGTQLEPLGFQRIGYRKWVRSQKQPIREMFLIETLKGFTYSPTWGFSSGIVPSFRSNSFHRQSSDKSAVRDLIIDPIDITGRVPRQTFGFITGYDTQIPAKQIRTCAEHFIPLALADFERIQTLIDFCRFFLERSQLQYRRFSFDMYVQHQLVYGFVLILLGHSNEGIEKIQEFCKQFEADFDNKILSECIQNAESFQVK